MADLRITVPDGGSFTVPRTHTYGELRHSLRESVTGVDDFVICEGDSDQAVSDEQAISSDVDSVAFKNLTIRVQDRGQIYTVEDVPANSSIQDFLAKFEQKHVKLDYVTIGGKKLDFRRTLREQDIKHNTLINGLLRVVIRDKDIENEVSVNISDHEKVSLLKKQYEMATSRILPKDSVLYMETEPEDGGETVENKLNDETTIYESGIKEDATLMLKTPAFTIKIKEKDEKNHPQLVEIKVRDEYTIRQVKALYSKALSEDAKTELEGLVENDKLIFKTDQLDDDKKVFQYRISENNILTVDREDVTSVKTTYMCADCGSLVLLNKNDIVRCRECGYRIVYKQRTTRPCQYLAR